MGRSMCRACLDLIAGWWRADRVRISPREGELLRLQPVCLVTIAGRPVEVLRRQEVVTLQTRGVRYECRTEAGPAHLDIRLRESASRLEICWSVFGRIEALPEHQIEIFG
jgi:hypothetical protein